MSVLFTPFQLGSLTSPNRFVRSATTEGLAHEEGFVTPELTDFLAEIALGGVGVLVLGYSYVSPEGKQLPRMTGIEGDDKLPGLKDLVRKIKEQSPETLLVMQIVHAGSQALPEYNGGYEALAPSAVENTVYKTTAREMSVQKIRRVIADFGEAGRRAREAGFDAVQLHGAHGYLINQFLSPDTNLRRDEYGVEDRSRFVREVVAELQSRAGADYPLWIKLNSEDFVPGGLELEPSLAVAETLEKMGVAAFEISGGTPAAGRKGVSRMRIKGPQDEAYFLPQIRRFRERLSSPVIAVGGFRSFEISEEVVARGHADLVALARALVREPHLIRRWREGDRSPALCISCNRCFKESMSVQGLGCHEERKKERKA